MNNLINQWQKAHVAYANYTKGLGKTLLEQKELEWRKKLLESPNGKLLIKNSFFDTLEADNTIYLQHTTRNLQKILKNKKMYSSGGCLAGSVYCTPLIKDGGVFRMHNLGKYIYDIEAPMMSKNQEGKIDTLVFEIKLSENSNKDLPGIDHLRLGPIYFSLYEGVKNLLTERENMDIQKGIVKDVSKSIIFLGQSSIGTYDSSKFFDLFVESIDSIPVLENLYFVAISEYLMLYQDNLVSREYSGRGELYNPTYKNLMYRFLNVRDSSNVFKPSIDDVVKYIEGCGIFNNFNKSHFKDFLVSRIIYLINSRLFNLINNPFSIADMDVDFETLIYKARPLVGHMINHVLKRKFPKVYSQFERNKATQVWDYWNQNNIQIPFNGVIPKGEVGINPSDPNLIIKAYFGRVTGNSIFGFVEPMEPLDIGIVPELVSSTLSVMRDGVKQKEGRPINKSL